LPGLIWLASYPKSGNTWMRAFLANYLENSDRPVSINDLPNQILGDGFVHHYEAFSGRKVEELSDEEIAELRPKVHEWFAHSRGKDVFVKTHSMIGTIAGKPLITPGVTAGAIYIARNPFDIVVSFSHHFQIDLQRAVNSLCEANYYLPGTDQVLMQFIGSWSRHVNSWTKVPGLVLHVVRYEDMVQKPLKTFGKVIEFLELPNRRDHVKRAIKFSSFRELAGQEVKHDFVESRPDSDVKFFRSGRVGGWRSVLSEAQVKQLIDAHGDTMRELGYLDRRGRPKGI
jgi:hypothetical protein